MKRNVKTAVWAVSQAVAALVVTIIIVSVSGCKPRTGNCTLHVLTTNDVHGAWFDSTYVGKVTRPSLLAVNTYVDSIRKADGRGNVLLIDAGDCLQGDNAPYYFNYVDTKTPHLFPRIVKYMKYDAVVVGNHDVETAHPVYDRVAKQMKAARIPFMAGNAIDIYHDPYFPEYKVFRRADLKVLVLGYTNANINAWLAPEIWSGMHFESLVPFVQRRVDAIVAKTKPDVVIVAVHSGTGDGDGKVLESQGLDLLGSLRGVDMVICSHDHRPCIKYNPDNKCILINAGSNARNIGHGQIRVSYEKGKEVDRKVKASMIRVDKAKADPVMREHFRKDYEAVKAFTMKEVGSTAVPLRSRDCYAGPCPYINLIHKVQLEATGAQISFAAPLSFNKVVRAGKLIYNDMFAIYPYENTLNTMELYGKEIVKYLEYSYDAWIQTYDGEHVLRIHNEPDPRVGLPRWSFKARTYNFDSAAGINYTVDITKPVGSRIKVLSMADGTAFDPETLYTVALTSYRAAGGGGLIEKGAGLSRPEMESRAAGKFPEIRDLIYDYISRNPELTPECLAEGIGSWSFVPEPKAPVAIDADMDLLFGKNR